jgi:hypothetical protein
MHNPAKQAGTLSHIMYAPAAASSDSGHHHSDQTTTHTGVPPQIGTPMIVATSCHRRCSLYATLSPLPVRYTCCEKKHHDPSMTNCQLPVAAAETCKCYATMPPRTRSAGMHIHTSITEGSCRRCSCRPGVVEAVAAAIAAMPFVERARLITIRSAHHTRQQKVELHKREITLCSSTAHLAAETAVATKKTVPTEPLPAGRGCCTQHPHMRINGTRCKPPPWHTCYSTHHPSKCQHPRCPSLRTTIALTPPEASHQLHASNCILPTKSPSCHPPMVPHAREQPLLAVPSSG